MYEEDIRKLLTTKKLIIGGDEVLKNARKGGLSKVYYASNADKLTIKDLTKYADLSGFELLDTKLSNDDLGTTCKKPFSISIIGVLK
ncbi:MAG TPA: ribosomal L7Ae/L30e/S12e/Gadd45 family protein [Alphaproteobacteria bacterium]|nr:ribosomal L7Ae/L30e/S12e/Gadd45 family protein [Alphaproteobacteria bacterium]